jgi:hypothetical protein
MGETEPLMPPREREQMGEEDEEGAYEVDWADWAKKFLGTGLPMYALFTTLFWLAFVLVNAWVYTWFGHVHTAYALLTLGTAYLGLLFLFFVATFPFDVWTLTPGFALTDVLRSIFALFFEGVSNAGAQDVVRALVLAFAGLFFAGIGWLLGFLFTPLSAASLGRPWSAFEYLTVRKVLLAALAACIFDFACLMANQMVKTELQGKDKHDGEGEYSNGRGMRRAHITPSTTLFLAVAGALSFMFAYQVTGGMGVFGYDLIFGPTFEYWQCTFSDVSGTSVDGCRTFCNSPEYLQHAFAGCVGGLQDSCPEFPNVTNATNLTEVLNISCSTPYYGADVPACCGFGMQSLAGALGWNFTVAPTIADFNAGAYEFCYEMVAWCGVRGKGAAGTCNTKPYSPNFVVNDELTIDDGAVICGARSQRDVVWGNLAHLFGAIGALLFYSALHWIAELFDMWRRRDDPHHHPTVTTHAATDRAAASTPRPAFKNTGALGLRQRVRGPPPPRVVVR